MPKINRFDAPATVGYTSQFVPEKLPQELMAGMLSAKQRKADQGLVQATTLGEFEQRAIGDHDTNYVKGIKSEVQQFADDAMNMDRTSPEFQRKYIELTRKIKSDPNLSKVASAVANYDEHAANIKRLKAAGDDEYAAELDYLYQQRLENYSKVGGEGFEGQGLADANIQKGQNEFETVMKYFDKVTADGYESLQKLGSGISYKNGFTAITDKKLQTQAANVFESFLESDMGNQMRLSFLMRDHGKTTDDLANMSKEERTKVDTDVMGSMRDRFMKIGLTKKFSKSTTTRDAALNAQRTEDKDNFEVVMPTSQTPYKVGVGQTEDQQIEAVAAEEKAIWLQLWQDKERVKKGLESHYTTQAKEGLRAKANLLKQQQKDLVLASSERYQNIVTAGHDKVQPQIDAAYKQQEILAAELKGLVGQEEYDRFFKKFTHHKDFWNGGYDAAKSQAAQREIDAKYVKITNPEKAGRVKKILADIVEYDKMKMRLSHNAEYDIYNTNIKEAQRLQWQGTTVQPSGVTVQTGKGTVMNTFNTQVASNSEAYNLRDSKGNIINIAQYGPDARITEFKGSAVTSTGLNKSKGTKMAVDGQATITVPNGRNKDGTAKTISFSIAVNAEPVGNNVQFYRNEFAREQRDVANAKLRSGDVAQANLAYTHALQLGNASIQNSLDNFVQSPGLTDLPIEVPAYSDKGEFLGNTSVLLEKIGDLNNGGGFSLQIGDKKVEYTSINQVNEAIQAATNSIEK